LASVMGSHQQQQQQERMSWSESIRVASADSARCRYRRSASVSCLQRRPARADVRRREGVRLDVTSTPSAFAESVFCYVDAQHGQSSLVAKIGCKCGMYVVLKNVAAQLRKLQQQTNR